MSIARLVRWSGPLVLLLIALLPSQASAAGSWSCEASALRATVLSQVPIEPLPANRGQGACRATSAGITTPAGLPLPLSLDALSARTTLSGLAPSRTQVAGATSGVADLRIRALPSLPLPVPDLGQNAVINVPLVGQVDLRPALQALLQPLPTADLLSAQAVQAQASARCVNNSPRLVGTSQIVGLAIGGRTFAVNQPITETIELIDTQSIDPSDIDLNKVILPLGVDLTPVIRGLLQPVLDALPTISVPPTLAHVRAIPNRQFVAGGRLTQRALDVHASIAGVTIADVAVAEATVGGTADVCAGGTEPPVNPPENPPRGDRRPPQGSPPPGRGTVDAALRCSNRRIVLLDVLARAGKVRLLGVADRRFAGRRVTIKLTANGRTVARPRVSSTGVFRATAKLPPRAIRFTSKARYRAQIGRERSLPLKLIRRMVVTRTTVAKGRVTIEGRLLPPFAARPQVITVKRRISCGAYTTVKRFRPSRNGRFRVTVDGPRRGTVGVYRLQTRVAGRDAPTQLRPTFTLPRFVEG